MNAPWRHHAVPQSLIRNFYDPGREGPWYFDKRRPNKGVKEVGPAGILYEPHQYSSIDIATGELDPALEHFFDRVVEHPAAPVIKKIIAVVTAGKKPSLTLPERDNLDLFLQFQLRRTRELARRYVPDFEADVAEGLAKAEEEFGELPPSIVDHFTTNQDNFTRNAIVGAQGRASPAIAALQRRRGLLVAVIADASKAFIIGSNPMVAFPAPGFPEFGCYGLWMPISSRVAISHGGPAGTEDVRAIKDHRAIRRFNELMFVQSDEIAGRSHTLIRSLINRR